MSQRHFVCNESINNDAIFCTVLIVSYDLYRMNSTLMSKAANIGLLVLDEGHKLKNTNGSQTLSAIQSLPCNARLLITGTPIQNCLSEFYNVASKWNNRVHVFSFFYIFHAAHSYPSYPCLDFILRNTYADFVLPSILGDLNSFRKSK